MPLPLAGLAVSSSYLKVTAFWLLAEISVFARKFFTRAAVAAGYLAGVYVVLDVIKAELMARMQGLPADFLAIATIMGVDIAATILISGVLTKHAVNQMSKGGTPT